MGEKTDLRERIEEFLSADSSREVTEEGELLFDLRKTEFRLEEAHGKLLLHLWSEERNWVRRVTGIAEESPNRLVLEVERFGQKRPGRLTFAPPSRRMGPDRDRHSARRAYSRFLRRLLQREFPRAEVERMSTATDGKRSFSGLFTRACLRERNRWWAVMGVNEAEDAASVDGLLTYALVWFDWNRERYPDRVWAGLRLFLPRHSVQTTAHRLAFFNPEKLQAELYIVDQQEGACSRVDLRDRGNLETRLELADHTNRIQQRESSGVARIRALAPQDIEEVALAGQEELVLRFRGLEFARAAGGEVLFGAGRQETRLTAENFSQLGKLVEKLRSDRKAGGNAGNPLYRWRAEGWLESLVANNPGKVDPRLLPQQIYRQVLVAGGSERGVADLLGVTRDGQLVVVELKASADIHLPLQGLDYWLRLHWHHQRGQIATAGYFPGVPLRTSPPELLLVAPALQFHSTTQIVVRYFSPLVRVALAGLTEDWRRELKVVWRETGN